MLTCRSLYRRAVSVLAFLPLLLGSDASAQAPPLTLTLELDDSTYLIGQPVIAVLSLTNQGAAPFEERRESSAGLPRPLEAGSEAALEREEASGGCRLGARGVQLARLVHGHQVHVNMRNAEPLDHEADSLRVRETAENGSDLPRRAQQTYVVALGQEKDIGRVLFGQEQNVAGGDRPDVEQKKKIPVLPNREPRDPSCDDLAEHALHFEMIAKLAI
jgi:hypothetical protein